MSVVSKILKKIHILFVTMIAPKWWRGLSVEGVFGKRFDTQIIISDEGKIIVGKNVLFQRNVSLSAIDGTLQIGNNVSFNRNCIVICRKSILIADNVIFGPGVTIYDHDHVFSSSGILLDKFKQGTVVIEKGCWIAANVTILRNTHIGEGSVVGAGATVKGDIPPHSLVTSNRTLSVIPIDNRK